MKPNFPWLPFWWMKIFLVWSAMVPEGVAQQGAYRIGDIVTTNKFILQNRYSWTNENGKIFAPGSHWGLSDFAGKIVFVDFFSVWCGNCQSALTQMGTGIRDYYAVRKGTSNGIPVAHVIVDISGPSYVQQTDAYLPPRGVRVCGSDLTKTLRNLIAPPGGTNGPDPRPVYMIINGVSNSTSHSQWQLLDLHVEPGGGAEDYSARIGQWRRIIDSVQAPAPLLSHVGVVGNSFEFTVSGQRGRTNRVESTTDLMNWSTVTNLFGTNAPIVIRATNAPQDPLRLFRVVRP